MTDSTIYFAYGSNLDPVGMELRGPTAEPLAAASLNDWQLTFRGVADIEPAEGEVVNGALWLCQPEDIDSLDMYEGHPHFYRQRMVTVQSAGGREVEAMTYVMVPPYRDRNQAPGGWYVETIADGYRFFELNLSSLGRALGRVSSPA
jgi:gamma-glutamylcyclotransferase (GGCT)/AIG2-like uncharacterized protein YtfP